ncbi:MAG: hypothetical protein K0Q72_1803, partial [Armatimonadetes bacterium]|nr:hypothetical protein [Armatimonadota bacterium]
MTDPTSPTPDVPGAATRRRRRLALRSCFGCCGCGCLAPLLLLFLAGWLILQRVPATFPLVKHPIPPPAQTSQLGGGLDGFESPYIGHTGSWNGQGGAMAGPKTGDMDLERSMGLRWT